MGAELTFERTPLNELPYSAGIMSQSSWFVEFKRIIGLVSEGRSEKDIRTECLKNNLLGAVKEYRAKRMFGYLMNRVKRLDEELIWQFMNGDLRTQKLINLIAILRGDRLFFEFIYEVYRETVILGQTELEDKDINVFFRKKGNQSELVESWNDSTKKHLKSSYIACLADAGLLRVEKKERMITTPMVDDRLATYLDQCGDHALLIAISGVA